MLLVSFGLAANEIKLTTYNVGLAHTFVPHAKERLGHLIEALKNHNSDVLCLQEVWKKSDRKKISNELEELFAQEHFTKIKNLREGRRPTCKVKELFGEGKFVSCMQNQCKGLDGDEFTDCILQKCGTALENLKQQNRQCATALMAQVGKNTILGMLTILNPIVRAGLFAYKGSDGLMLLSRYPIKEKGMEDFSSISTLNRRRALTATLDVEGKDLTVYCTHLSADLSRTVPYTGKFSSWSEENKIQINQLMTKANAHNSSVVVMGDFNCGFSSSGIDAELPENCNALNAPGFINALESTGPECTFCQDNTLNDGETKSVAIDHIIMRGPTLLNTSVDFKDIVTIKDGIQTNLSDHFGVSATVEIN